MENDNKKQPGAPGVYITNEINAFPNSVTGVATAIPAFIGYTPQAAYAGNSYMNKPVKISSFLDFKAIFCYPEPTTNPAQQYAPNYYLMAQQQEPQNCDYLTIDGVYYAILPDPATIYYLYNSVRLFYQNGGGDAYIVSVGSYGQPNGKSIQPGQQLVNPNVQLSELIAGLNTLESFADVTMYICPEATLLSTEENATLMQNMLQQSAKMGTSVSIFDLIGSDRPTADNYDQLVQTFRNSTGNQGLDFGAAYFPFIGTTVMSGNEINYTNLFGGNIQPLAAILDPNPEVSTPTGTILKMIQSGDSGNTVQQLDNALQTACPIYGLIMNHVLQNCNLLPPSGAIAGVISTVDNQYGPWKAPANCSIVGATSLPIRLTDDQQAGLNVDVVSGKSINAIRFFNGLGILIWGARTLDGNSQDWRYLSIRRTMIYIEQSCKLAARAYIFEPNTKNTWEAVKAMISSFLTSVWKEGGLQGATPADAFSVDCGLGTTMTADDILNGFMNVMIKVAVARPAEFIVITFQQEQAVSS